MTKICTKENTKKNKQNKNMYWMPVGQTFGHRPSSHVGEMSVKVMMWPKVGQIAIINTQGLFVLNRRTSSLPHLEHES